MTTQTPQSFSTSGAGVDPTQANSEGGASVRERATQVGGTAKDEAAGVAQEVKYQTRDLVGEARGQVRQQVDTQKGRLGDLLRDIGEELEQMAERSDRNGIASDLARQAAARTRDVRGYLDGGGDIVDDVRRFARRRPGTFLLGALAAGVIAGRATRAATAAKRQSSSGSAGEVGGQSGGYSGSAYPGTYAGGSAGYAGQYAGAGSAPGYDSPGYPATTTAGGFSTTAGTTATAYPEYPEQFAVPSSTPSTAPTSGYAAAPTTQSYGATSTGAIYQDPDATYDPASGYGSGTVTDYPAQPSSTGTPIERSPLDETTRGAEGYPPPNSGERS